MQLFWQQTIDNYEHRLTSYVQINQNAIIQPVTVKLKIKNIPVMPMILRISA
jgi:hypothetical protein